MSEFVALVSLSTTVFLFLHTKSLTDRLSRVREPYSIQYEDTCEFDTVI